MNAPFVSFNYFLQINIRNIEDGLCMLGEARQTLKSLFLTKIKVKDVCHLHLCYL